MSAPRGDYRPGARSLLHAPTCSWRAYDPASFEILIADDSRETRIGLRTALAREGYRVQEVADGVALLEHLSRHSADLILLDVMMPEKDGLSVLKDLRSDPRLDSIYVILLTGRSSVEEKVEGLTGGADDYLTKPFDLKELLARVQAGIRIKALHRELRESQETIVRQEKRATIGRLAAGIAHEFNNLMSAISGYAQLARNNEKYRERLIEVALSQVQRAQKITSSLSSFAGSGYAGSQRTPVQPLVEAALCLLEKEFRNREITVQSEVSEDLPLIQVEKGQMQQVIFHLLLNAAQAAGRPGRVAIRCRSKDERVLIEVDDTGPGVPPELRRSIFDPFFTTKGALGNAEEPGTGLGLSFSLNTITEFGGTLELAPSELGGACFRISLPAVRVAALAPPTPSAAPRPHVVLVEDDPDLQEIVGEVLAGADLHVFADGPSALAYCCDHAADTVIVDLQLSGPWDGAELVQRLGQLPTPPPVVVTTGSLEVTRENLPPGVKAVLHKPYGLEDLERTLLATQSGAR